MMRRRPRATPARRQAQGVSLAIGDNPDLAPGAAALRGHDCPNRSDVPVRSDFRA